MTDQWEVFGRLMLSSIREDIMTAKAELLAGPRRSALEYIEAGEMIYTEALVHIDELIADLGRPSDPETAGCVDRIRQQIVESAEHFGHQHRQLTHETI